MRRLLLIFSVFILTSTTVFANDITSLINALTNSIPFGYRNEKIVVKEIDASRVVLESPVIADEGGDDILAYTVMYGPVPLSELEGDNIDALDDYMEKQFTFTSISTNTFTMELQAVADKIDVNKIYYVTIVPKNKKWDMGEISATEICFRLSDKTYGEGNECVSGVQQVHSAWSMDMALAGINHVRNGNNITVRWTALDGAQRVQLALANNANQTFTVLATVNMSSESYTFPITTSAPQRVRFTALDSNGNQVGKEFIYTMNEQISSTPQTPTTPTRPTTPGVPHVPTVWPKENIILVVILTLMAYGVTRWWRRNHSR